MSDTPKNRAIRTAKVVSGYDAIDYAESRGSPLRKYADPTEGPRDGLTRSAALAVAREDPSLIWTMTTNEEDNHVGQD